MESLSELFKEIESLPKGNVYPKTINGKRYWYHQYFDLGKRYSTLLKEEEVEPLLEKINRRKALEKEYKLRTKAKDTALSDNARSQTGYIMMGDEVVAIFDNGNLVSLDEEKSPLILKRTHSLDEFLKLRAIDGSRTNARLLKKALGIKENDDSLISLSSYGASISDNFWFKPKHSKLKHKDINFQTDAFAEISLKGETLLFPGKRKSTPELTTTGSFEKGWKRIDGEWWLYKQGSQKEIFSELFCYHFASLLSLPSAIYEYDAPYIRSKNFATSTNFQPMAALVGDDDSFEAVFKALLSISEKTAKEYLLLILFDAIVYNVDRHNENYGLLSDRDSGEILSLAPSFDCNLALISRNDDLPSPSKDGLIKLFLNFATKNQEARRIYKEMALPDIQIEEAVNCIKKIPAELHPTNADKLAEAIVERYLFLKAKFSN